MVNITVEQYSDLLRKQSCQSKPKNEHVFTPKQEVGSIKIIIFHLQKSLNILLRQHWAKYQKEQKVFDILVHKFYTENYQGENFRGKQVKIIHTLYFKDRKKRDLSNYGQKMMDDSLVREGIIDDDNSSVVIEESVRIRHDKENPRTETEIFRA